MKIIVVGHMSLGSNSRSLADGFAAAGNDVRCIDTSFASYPKIGSPLWASKKILQRVTRGANARVQSDLRQAEFGFRADLLVAIKTIMFDQDALLSSKAARRVHVSFDDVSNSDNITSSYLASELYWDAIVTTKRHNIAELEGRGVGRVISIQGAYDPSYQRITVPFRQRPHGIGFIGAARPDRSHLPREMASRVPHDGIVYGPRWERHYPKGLEGVKVCPNVELSEYTAAANSIRMGLVLLNSDNRDTHTMRSYETPACGQLFLGQRTSEHSSMFEEGSEALFFDTWEELWSQAEAGLREPARMERIAEAGHRRLIEGKNTYSDRANEILAAVNES